MAEATFLITPRLPPIIKGMRQASLGFLLLFAVGSTGLYAEQVCGPVTVSAVSGAPFQTEIETEVCSQINSKFQTGNLSSVLGFMARAYAVAAQGRVADYGANMQVFSFGAATTLAVSNVSVPTSYGDLEALGKRLSAQTVPDVGTGFSATATLGISLRTMNLRKRGLFDPKNLNIYASFFLLPSVTYQSYSINATTGSVYLQYKLLPMRKLRFALLTWGGLDLGVGYTYSTSKFSVTSTDKLTTINFTSNGKNIVYEPTGSLSLAYTTHMIPVELSTNVSLLYFLSLVFGAAADFHVLTSAELAANVSGAVKVDGVSGPGDYARFNTTETGKVSGVGFRVFGGPQFNIWKMRLFTLAHATSDSTYGVTLGARFTW